LTVTDDDSSGVPGSGASGRVPEIAPVDQLVLPPLRPSSAWYAVGVTVIVLGLAGAFGLLTSGAFGYLHEVNALLRMDVPGEVTVEMREETVAIYHEPEGGPLVSLASLDLEVTDPEGQAVTVRPTDGDDRYFIEDRHGISVGEFTAESPGAYRIEARGDASGHLAIGPSPRRRLTWFGLGAVVVAVVGIVVGTVILVVTRRRRARARAARLVQQQASRVDRMR
jgi:hypothetical protein